MKYLPLIVLALCGLCAICFSLGTPAVAADLNEAMKLNNTGEQLVEKGQYRQAIGVFERMRDSCGTDEYCEAVALFWLGRCRLEVSEYDQAMEFLKNSETIFTKMNKSVERAKVLNVMGRVFSERTDYDQALTYYDLAEKLLGRIGQRDDSELFWVLVNKASVNIYLNKYDKAVKDLDQAEKLLPRKPDARRLGVLQENRGLIHAEQQDYVKAMEYYDNAIKHYKSIGNLRAISGVLNKKGQVYEYQSKYVDALREYQEALNISEQLQDRATQAFILNNLGMVHRKRGNYDKSIEAYKSALAIRSQIGKDRFYSETLNNMGLVNYLAHPQSSETYANFKECYQVAKKVGSRYSEASALHNMAWVLKDQGNFNQAREFSQAAILLAEEIKNRRFTAQATLRLGNLYEYYGSFDEALKQYKKATDLQEKVGDRLFLSHTLVDMANVMTREGELEDAEKNYRKALNIKQDIGVPVTEILCKFALFFMEKERYSQHRESRKPDREKDLRQADVYIKQAEDKIKPDAIDDVMLLTYAKGRYFLEKDPRKATGEFTSLKSQADSSGRLKYSFLALTGLGRAYEGLGELAQAEKAYEAAVSVAEELRKTLDVQARRTFLDGAEILGVKHVLPYEGLARVRILKGDPTGSLEASEFTKARSFSDKLAQRVEGSSFGVDKGLLEELENAENRMRTNYQRLEECRSKEGDRSSIPKLEARGNELNAELKQIAHQIEDRYPKFHAVRFPKPLSIDKSALNENETSLCYQVTDTGVIVYLTQGKNILGSWFEPVTRSELNELVRKFRGPLEISDEKQFVEKLRSFDFATGRKLREILLDRALPMLKHDESILIVPDDCLAELPFEMLVMNEGGTVLEQGSWPVTKGVEFLDDRNPVTYCQSITALTLERRWRKIPASRPKMLVIADPAVPEPVTERDNSEHISKDRQKELEQEAAEYIARIGNLGDQQDPSRKVSLQTYNKLIRSFSALPQTRKLVDKLKNMFGKERVEDYAGEKATLDAFEKQIAPNMAAYDNIVFATHGYYGNNFEEIREPFLLLSLNSPRLDSLLRMSRIMNLNVHAEVVALVACQTGLGKRVSGEGTMGMGTAFQYAGAKSVLMSLWSVDADSSVKLVEHFFKYMAEGKSKIEALRLARKDIRKDGHDHPFFWAPFILAGETARP